MSRGTADPPNAVVLLILSTFTEQACSCHDGVSMRADNVMYTLVVVVQVKKYTGLLHYEDFTSKFQNIVQFTSCQVVEVLCVLIMRYVMLCYVHACERKVLRITAYTHVQHM